MHQAQDGCITIHSLQVLASEHNAELGTISKSARKNTQNKQYVNEGYMNKYIIHLLQLIASVHSAKLVTFKKSVNKKNKQTNIQIVDISYIAL